MPLLRLRADAGEPLAAVADDRRDVGEGLDVVDQRRLAPQAADRPDTADAGVGVPRRPSIEAISAVSSPQTNAPAPSRISTSKLKGVLQIVVAEQAAPPRLANGRGQPRNRERILRAHVDEALARAHARRPRSPCLR